MTNDEKNIKNSQNNNINSEYNNNEKLIKLLEIQLKELEKKIEEKETIIEKDITVVSNRLDKEIEKTRKFSLEKLISDLLPISDNIERALNIIETNKSKENFIEILNKLKFTSNLLEEFFKSFNVKKIDSINVLFNPSIHEAMSVHYTNEIESNQIVTVMQSGYILHESRLLRPAMVVVSKKNI